MTIQMDSPFQRGMVELRAWGWRCLRCSHEWLPRMESTPKVCPKCHSPYWDKPRDPRYASCGANKRREAALNGGDAGAHDDTQGEVGNK